MSKFKMKNRPKKPEKPAYVTYEMGNCFKLDYLQKCIDKFKNTNPQIDMKDVYIEAEYCTYNESEISLTAAPYSNSVYEAKLEAYKIELKTYKSWQDSHKKEIEKYKAANKKATAKRKLKRTQERLAKEMAAVEAKLKKA